MYGQQPASQPCDGPWLSNPLSKTDYHVVIQWLDVILQITAYALILIHQGVFRRRSADGVGTAAPALVFRKHGSGRPWVTVRAYYEGLPEIAGWTRCG